MRPIFVLLLSLFVLSTFAQDERDLPETDDNYFKYLDDGKKNDADADLKIALSSLVNGFIDIQYEHKLTNTFSVQGSGAIQVAPGLDLTDIDFVEYIDEFKTGYGFGIEGRRYGGYAAITDLGYWSIVYRNRTSVFETSKLAKNDIFFSRGNKYLFLNTLSAELSYGIGARFYNYDVDEEKNKIDQDEKFAFIHYNIQLKLGYYIKY